MFIELHEAQENKPMLVNFNNVLTFMKASGKDGRETIVSYNNGSSDYVRESLSCIMSIAESMEKAKCEK
jgi:hypothetical protein